VESVEVDCVQSARMTLISMRFDLRRPEWADVDRNEQYQTCLEMCRWADRVGIDVVVLSEHHGTPDGYMSAPVTLAAAVAGITERVAINVSALLAPMHDPIRLAEQLVVVDHVSKGRLSVILGTGYRQEEFEMMGIEFKDRLNMLESHVGALRSAFTGEYFEHEGRRVRVTPTPFTPGGPMMILGGSSEAAARRAARLNVGLAAADSDPRMGDWYRDECEKVGFRHGFAMIPHRLGFVHVSDDPDRDWEIIGPHALWDAQTYGSWQRSGQSSAVHVAGVETVEDVQASGVYRVSTAAECIDDARQTGSIVLHPLMGGLAPDVAWEGLLRFEQQVLPALKG
jgi:alkanesulfonate monooxygenase SsuD/methylene tetrahydromethanopterin reductase-like flavin-dependent oxidoreductase (luciferase family)